MDGSKEVYDRALLLHGAKRNEVLTLAEVHQYGIDSFGDADYVRVYGMPPAEWYDRGIRLLGRTAVECTRDALGDVIGRDVAALAATVRFPPDRGIIVFVAPPWGAALDERTGLDLRRTTPPIHEVVESIVRTYAPRPLLFAIQVYEKVEPDSLTDLRAQVDWSELRIYGLNDEGRNHGILLAAKGWTSKGANVGGSHVGR